MDVGPVSGTLAQIVIVGGGEHACVVADAVLADGNLRLLGYLDSEARPAMHSRWSLTHLGDDGWLVDHPGVLAVLGVGGVGVSPMRREIVARIGLTASRWATVVHPSARVSPTAELKVGAVVMAGAVVQTGAIIGAHTIVNSGAVIEHDVIVDDFAQVGPGAVVGGGCVIGNGAFVGLGSLVRDHLRIGQSAMVAMGAVVTSDVAPDTTVAGVPAREWRR